MLKERLLNGHKKAGHLGVPPRTHPFTLVCMHKSQMVRPIVVNPNTNCKEIQPVHSKGDQPWVFFGKNETPVSAKAETPVLWPHHANS